MGLAQDLELIMKNSIKSIKDEDFISVFKNLANSNANFDALIKKVSLYVLTVHNPETRRRAIDYPNRNVP